MKIKKSEYKKYLEDSFRKGFEAGINYALNNPKEAEKYRSNIIVARKYIEAMTVAFKPCIEVLNKMFASQS